MNSVDSSHCEINRNLTVPDARRLASTLRLVTMQLQFRDYTLSTFVQQCTMQRTKPMMRKL